MTTTYRGVSPRARMAAIAAGGVQEDRARYRAERAKYRRCPFRPGPLQGGCDEAQDGCLFGCSEMQARGLYDDGRHRPRKQLPRCGAKTRAGGECKVRIEPGKLRCRFHGGKSTGPRTEEGRARIAEAQRRRWQAFRDARAAAKEAERVEAKRQRIAGML